MKIYVVCMYRWGGREGHSYVAGAYVDDEARAVRCGKDEMDNRGRKYEPEVICFDHTTDPPQMSIVLHLGEYHSPINTSFMRLKDYEIHRR